MERGIFFGIGTNLDPLENMPRILAQLVETFEEIRLSHVIRTAPEKMDSDQFFLNAVGYLETPRTPEEVKALFNAIETRLGRDRKDPGRKWKDRAADIDILCVLSPTESVAPCNIPEESYVRPCFQALAGAMGKLPHPAEPFGESVELPFLDQCFGGKVCLFRRHPESGAVRIH